MLQEKFKYSCNVYAVPCMVRIIISLLRKEESSTSKHPNVRQLTHYGAAYVLTSFFGVNGLSSAVMTRHIIRPVYK